MDGILTAVPTQPAALYVLGANGRMRIVVVGAYVSGKSYEVQHRYMLAPTKKMPS